MDNMDTSIQEIFAGELTSKAVDSAKPCVELLIGYLQDPQCLTKESFNKCLKAQEEASLIATAMPHGEKFRGSLQIAIEVLKMAYLLDGPEKHVATTQYAFIKEARDNAGRTSDEILGAFQELARLTKLMEAETLDQLVSVRQKFIDSGKTQFEEVKTCFTEKLDASMVQNAVIPAEVESISSIDSITADFLQKNFDMQESANVSEKTIALTTLLRDAKVACSFMGIDVKEFIDTKKYEVNNRSGLAFLYLVTVFFVFFNEP